FLAVQIGAIVFMALGIAFSGWWSDRATPRIVLMAGSALAIVCGLVMAPMMQAGSLGMVFGFLSLSLFVMGLVYGPLGAFLPHLFPARVRYTGASAAFNVGGVIGGGFTPSLALALAKQGGLPRDGPTQTQIRTPYWVLRSVITLVPSGLVCTVRSPEALVCVRVPSAWVTV